MKNLWMFGAAWLLALCGSNQLFAQQNGPQPGAFDYYLLTLSWSPEYCHSHSTNTQCVGSKHFGFVVHGLWPEYTKGGYPEYCSKAPGLSDPTTMLDIMPDPNLISHEWITHGTCSGLDADGYFALVRKAFTSVHIPAQFASPTKQFNTTLTALKSSFVESNSNLSPKDMEVTCTNNYLNSVEICLRKDLTPMPCPNPRDCRAKTIRVPR
jgi:ribonuclease T2